MTDQRGDLRLDHVKPFLLRGHPTSEPDTPNAAKAIPTSYTHSRQNFRPAVATTTHTPSPHWVNCDKTRYY
jgi:hypothetical protein